MATNTRKMYTRTGQYPVPAGRTSGQAVCVGGAAGGIQGVLVTSEGALDGGGVGNPDGYATLALDGSFMLPVTTATAVPIGGPIYIIAATHVLTTTPNSGANPLFGHANTAKGTGNPETIEVQLDPPA
jgi:predicted RecA/RadA family phage recombinase